MAYGLLGSSISTSRTGGKNPSAVAARRSGVYSSAAQSRARAAKTAVAGKSAFGAAASNFGKGTVAALKSRQGGAQGGIGQSVRSAVSAYKAAKAGNSGIGGAIMGGAPKMGPGSMVGGAKVTRKARKSMKREMKAMGGKAAGYRRAMVSKLSGIGAAKPRVDM